MKYQIILAMLLTACGHDDSQNAKDPTPPADTGAKIERPAEEPKEVTVEYRKDGDQIALALDDTKDLPACTNANAQQLSLIHI